MKRLKTLSVLLIVCMMGFCGCNNSENEALKKQMEELQKQNEELSNKLKEMGQKTDVEATEAPEPTATSTPVPTGEPTAMPTPTEAPVVEPTEEPTPTCTPLPTATPEPTSTPTPIPTSTPVPTATPKPMATPTPKPSPKPTATPIPTATPLPTPTPDPRVVISKDTIISYRKEIELTEGNWEDYYELKTYEYVEKDAFDEFTGVESKFEVIVLKEPYIQFNEVLLKFDIETENMKMNYDPRTGLEHSRSEEAFYDKSTVIVKPLSYGTFSNLQQRKMSYVSSDNGALYQILQRRPNSIDGYDYIWQSEYTLKSYDLVNIKGSIFEWNIPEESWNVDENGLRYILVDHGFENGERYGYDKYWRFYEDGYYVKRDTSDRKNKISGWKTLKDVVVEIW